MRLSRRQAVAGITPAEDLLGQSPPRGRDGASVDAGAVTRDIAAPNRRIEGRVDPPRRGQTAELDLHDAVQVIWIIDARRDSMTGLTGRAHGHHRSAVSIVRIASRPGVVTTGAVTATAPFAAVAHVDHSVDVKRPGREIRPVGIGFRMTSIAGARVVSRRRALMTALTIERSHVGPARHRERPTPVVTVDGARTGLRVVTGVIAAGEHAQLDLDLTVSVEITPTDEGVSLPVTLDAVDAARFVGAVGEPLSSVVAEVADVTRRMSGVTVAVTGGAVEDASWRIVTARAIGGAGGHTDVPGAEGRTIVASPARARALHVVDRIEGRGTEHRAVKLGRPRIGEARRVCGGVAFDRTGLDPMQQEGRAGIGQDVGVIRP
jgi:hypothetical protein